MSNHVSIELFGGLRIRSEDGASVDVSLQQTGALLAVLALRLGGSYTREELADLIWPDDDIDVARHRLRQRLYALRQILEPLPLQPGRVLLSTRSAIQLSPEAVSTDVATFDRLLDSASQTSDPALRRELLAEAVGLYGGELLPGLYLDLIIAERNRVSLAYQGALVQLVRLLDAAGATQRALEIAGRALAMDPLNEESHCDLIRLHAAMGQPSHVERQYRQLEETLADELGIAPSAETRERYQTSSEEARRVAAQRTHSATTSPDATATPRTLPPQLQLEPQGAEPVHHRRWFLSRRALLSALCLSLILLAALPTPLGRNGKKPVAASASAAGLKVDKMFSHRLLPSDHSSEPTAVTTNTPNIYVAGFVQTNTKNDVDFLTLKIDADDIMTERRYNGPGSDLDRARCIAVDPRDGSVYVAGESDNGRGENPTRLSGLDIALIKYDQNLSPSTDFPDNGAGRGVRRYNDVDDGDDRPRKMLIDRDGSVLILCTCRRKRSGKDAGQDFVVLKYGPNGQGGRIFRYDGGGDDEPVDMIIDHDGHIYVTGYTTAVSRSGPELDFMTIKLDPDGTKQWAVSFGANNRGDDRPKGMVLGPAGNVCVVGDGVGLPGTADEGRRGCVAANYSPSGDLLWNRGTSGSEDRLTDVKLVFPLGDGIVISGTSEPPRSRTIYRDLSFGPRWSNDAASYKGTGVQLSSGAIAATHSNALVLVLGYDFLLPQVSAALDLFDQQGNVVSRSDLCRDAGPIFPRVAVGGPPGLLLVAGQSVSGKRRNTILIRYTSK